MTGKEMIYIIKTHDENAIKIGYSKTKAGIEKRLSGLQTGNHKRLSLLHYFQGGRSIEKIIHGFLYQYHLSGEWFDYTSLDVQIFVNNLIDYNVYEALRSISTDKEYNPYYDISARNSKRRKDRIKP